MRFQLQTILTTNCNLDCSYCYMRVNKNKRFETLNLEDFKQALDFLPEIQEVINWVNVPGIGIHYFGGEPLIKYDSIIKCSYYARKKLGDIECAFPTNGTLLTKEKVNELDASHILYSISYDGPYNSQRVNSLLPSKFLLERMKERGVKCMISPKNVKEMYNNFIWFIENEINFPSMSIVRDNCWTQTSISEFEKQLNKIYEYIIREYENDGKLYLPQLLSLPILDTIINSNVGSRRKTTCFAGTNGVAIFGNGDIYPCARFGANSRFLLGNYKKRKLDKNKINFIQEKANNIDHPDCIPCELYTVCNAGCLYSQLASTNWKQNKMITSICNLYKIIYSYSYDLYDKLSQEKPYLNYILHNLSNG